MVSSRKAPADPDGHLGARVRPMQDPDATVARGKFLFAQGKDENVEIRPRKQNSIASGLSTDVARTEFTAEEREQTSDSSTSWLWFGQSSKRRDAPEMLNISSQQRSDIVSREISLEQREPEVKQLRATNHGMDDDSLADILGKKAEEETAEEHGTSQNVSVGIQADDKPTEEILSEKVHSEAIAGNEQSISQGNMWTNIMYMVRGDEAENEKFDTNTKVDVDNHETASTTGESTNLFGDDLKSLPSVGCDETVPAADAVSKVEELDVDELMSKGVTSHVESIVNNKVQEIAEKSLETDGQTTPAGDVKASSPSTLDGETRKSSKTLSVKRQKLVRELRASIATFGRYDPRCASISADLGDVLSEMGDHEQAIKLHKDAVTIYSCKLGDDHTTTNEARVRLGAVLENAGQFDEAINTYFFVTVMRRSLKGEQDPSAADGIVHIAHTLRKKKEYLQSIKELKRALKIYRESLGDAHEKVSSTVDEIASLYVTIGDFEKSAAILEEVVKLKAATVGANTKAVALTLSNLATTYECSEQFTKAMKTLKKAYKIYTEIDGYSSEDSTDTLNRIAQLYEATGDFNRASIAYLGVLRGRKIRLGSDNLLVGETYYKLGHALRSTGQLEKALRCMKEALPIFVSKGKNMNDVEMIADIMHEMAFINKDKKQYSDAARIFRQEYSVRRKIGQPEFPHIARTLNHLGSTEYELKNYSRSLKYLVEALTIFQDQGEHGIDCAEVLYNTGLVFEAVRNRERALEAFTESARIFGAHGYQENHPHLLRAKQKIDKLKNMDLDSAGKPIGERVKKLFK